MKSSRRNREDFGNLLIYRKDPSQTVAKLFPLEPLGLSSEAKAIAAVCGAIASSPRQQAIRAGSRLCGQIRSDAVQDVRTSAEGYAAIGYVIEEEMTSLGPPAAAHP